MLKKQRHPRVKTRMRRRLVFGYLSDSEEIEKGKFIEKGPKTGVDIEALEAAIESVAIIDETGWHIKGPENMARFMIALNAAVKARADLTPEPPSKNACLDDWFEWQDKMHERGQICSLEDVAEQSGRALGTVQKAHWVYISDRGEM